MTELSEINVPKNVCIEGNKDNFNSKIAIDKFKKSIKKMDLDGDINLEELQKKYLKPAYKFELVTNDKLNINLKVLEVVTTPSIDTKKILKDKIKIMTKNRQNISFHKAKLDDNVSPEILKEYTRLKKISKMPVPEPCEVLSNPEQFKPILSMVLNNKMLNQMGANHPYIKYFKLLADKLNISINPVGVPEQLVENESINTNKISKDEDTDEED